MIVRRILLLLATALVWGAALPSQAALFPALASRTLKEVKDSDGKCTKRIALVNAVPFHFEVGARDLRADLTSRVVSAAGL